MSFPPRFLDELRARLSLSDVVGKRVRLIRAGREHKACCPFHKEKTPSFTLNDQKGFFHCFGCGAHGDVISFVMRADNLEFVEAVTLLAGEAGLPVPRTSPQDEVQQQRHQRLLAAMEAAAAWFAARLGEPPAAQARRYLAERGIDAATVAAFRLGYAPPDGQALRQFLRKAGYTDDEMLEVGLLRQPEGGGQPYAFFRDRVMIPIGDARDRVISFGARLMGGEGPKYLNGPDSPLFRKGESLFNLGRARAARGGEGDAFLVVEGYFDVITLVRAGYGAAVAPLGTALTEDQMRAVWRAMRANGDGIKAPILCFDGDDAGRRAAHRFAEKAFDLIEPALTLRFTFLPQGEDPDSLLRRPDGRAVFRQCLEAAEPLVDFLWHWKLREKSYDTPEERATLRKYFLDKASRIQDRSLQQLYRDAFLDRCYQHWRGQRRPDATVIRFPGPGGQPAPAEGTRAIRVPPDAVLVSALINHPDVLDDFLASLDLIHFGPSGHAHTVFRFASRALYESPGMGADDLQAYLSAIDSRIGPILDRLNLVYRTHVNRGNRSELDVREIFFDLLRFQQMARLRHDLVEAYLRNQTDPSDIESERIAAILDEMRRLQTDQNAVLDRSGDDLSVLRNLHCPVVTYETAGLDAPAPQVAPQVEGQGRASTPDRAAARFS